MKKILLLLPITGLAILSFASCNDSKDKEGIIKFYLPDGTPSLAVANMLDEGFTYHNKKIEFKIEDASTIGAKIASDDCTLAICPTIVAAKIYTQGVKIKIATNNVFGNLYVVSTGKSNKLTDLIGKKIYTTSGTTKSLLEYELKKNNIEYIDGETAVSGKVTFQVMSSASEYIPILKQAAIKDEEAIAILGEPAVTNAISKVGDKLKIIVDMQEEYSKISQTTKEKYPQASMVVKESFANSNKEFMNKLYDKLNENMDYLKNNYSTLGSILGKEEYQSSIASTTFTLDTIKRCNIGLEKAYMNKEYNNNYIKELMNGLSVSDDFYFEF